MNPQSLYSSVGPSSLSNILPSENPFESAMSHMGANMFGADPAPTPALGPGSTQQGASKITSFFKQVLFPIGSMQVRVWHLAIVVLIILLSMYYKKKSGKSSFS